MFWKCSDKKQIQRVCHPGNENIPVAKNTEQVLADRY
jgi:hypothetical protein